MSNRKIWIFILFSLCISSVSSQEVSPKFVASNDKHISYMGRIGFTDSCAEIYWIGTSVTINEVLYLLPG